MRVLVITGAGISAESGIPTFRGNDGYWRNLDPLKLATPEAFEDDPSLVWEWYRERRKWIREAQPNAAHVAVVTLAQHANEFMLVTQNVDDLHARAGLSPEKMVQIHGNIFLTQCSQCDFEEPPVLAVAEPKRGRLRSIARTLDASSDIPTCPQCGALMRPGVVWFGEQLDARKIQRVEDFLAGGPCDLVLVIGTTALFGYVVDWATRPSRELIEINPEQTPLSQFATKLVREPAAIALPRIVENIVDAGSAQTRPL